MCVGAAIGMPVYTVSQLYTQRVVVKIHGYSCFKSPQVLSSHLVIQLCAHKRKPSFYTGHRKKGRREGGRKGEREREREAGGGVVWCGVWGVNKCQFVTITTLNCYVPLVSSEPYNTDD